MSETHQVNPQAPVQCVQGCGFFGNPSTENYCSKCYKEHQDSIKAKKAETPAIQKVEVVEPQLMEIEEPVAAVALQEAPTKKKKKSKKNRCNQCNRKVTLFDSHTCRCEHNFCAQHRLPRDHACEFDVKTFQKDNLAKANPKLTTAKLEKI